MDKNGCKYLRKAQTGTLQLAGSLSIVDVKDLLHESRKAANDSNASKIVISIKALESIDTSAVQVLVALSRVRPCVFSEGTPQIVRRLELGGVCI